MGLLLGILQVLAIYVVLPALVGLIIVGVLLTAERFRARRRVKLGAAGLVCSVDADCPEGYVCREGACVPANS